MLAQQGCSKGVARVSGRRIKSLCGLYFQLFLLIPVKFHSFWLVLINLSHRTAVEAHGKGQPGPVHVAHGFPHLLALIQPC